MILTVKTIKNAFYYNYRINTNINYGYTSWNFLFNNLDIGTTIEHYKCLLDFQLKTAMLCLNDISTIN